MGATFLPVNEIIVEMLTNAARQNGYRALDLITELDSSYEESDVQKGLAQLLTDGTVILTSDRKIKLKG